MKQLVQRLFPQRCVLCGTPTTNRTTPHGLSARCIDCSPPMKECNPILTKPSVPLPWSKLYSFAVYQEPIQQHILSYKYEEMLYLAPFFADCLCSVLQYYHLDTTMYDCCVPIPLHTSKLRKRGFNQLTEILRYARPYTIIPIHMNMLICTTAHKSQQQLGLEERLENANNIFIADESARGKRILLFDDVATTGVTLASACCALFVAGAYSVDCLTIAVNERGINEELVKTFLEAKKIPYIPTVRKG